MSGNLLNAPRTSLKNRNKKACKSNCKQIRDEVKDQL